MEVIKFFNEFLSKGWPRSGLNSSC